MKKLKVDANELLKALHRWRNEAIKAGYAIERIPNSHGSRESSGMTVRQHCLGH